ncbi:MAG: hypothetical protein ACPL7J_04875, partial [Desulfomonilaceae bacterium]
SHSRGNDMEWDNSLIRDHFREWLKEKRWRRFMNWEDWGFAFFMADSERRRAKEEAEAEREQLEAEYDQWCIDHGIPPPPKREREPEPSGCGCFTLVIIVGLIAWGIVILYLTTP